MAKIKIELNKKEIEVEAGITILEAAARNGIYIPTLCHDQRLKPTAACRLCIVEVEKARVPMAACTTPVSEGMSIKTDSDNIFKLRQMALELLLSDHYGDCVAPCKLACPAGIDIQGFIAHIANGQYLEALKLIKDSNPLPLVCGRVCPRFCEQKCRRNLVDEPVAINALKRFVADLDISSDAAYIPDKKPATGYKVAIIGGGPAGLTAAYYLAIEGHSVTIFDSNPKLGGMLRYGIPEYRLPKSILDKEIKSVTGLCSEVKLNTRLGNDFTLESLKQSGFNSIFISIGAQSSQGLKIEGEDLPGVISGIRFLGDVTLGKKLNIGEKVAIVGGGNTAIDAARTALRLNASDVTIVYRRSRQEMPASKDEIEQAELEGVKFQFLAAPVKVIGRNGKANGLECIKMALGEPDASGRRRPEPVPGSEFTLEVDTIIAAIGQTIDVTGTPQEIQNERKHTLISQKDSMETSIPGIFAGGDCVTGPATAVEAIAAGKKAAISINQYLHGGNITPVTKPYNCSKGELGDIDVAEFEKFERLPRSKMPELSLKERAGNFREVELGLGDETAKAESARCLACGCQDVFECELRKLATEYKINDSHYAGRKSRFPIKEEEHPLILRDPNKCILCGRCVRICSEVENVGALGYIRRGFDTTVGPAIDMPLAETLCQSCGQCVSTCPTGALNTKNNLPKSGPWQLDRIPSVCPYCSTGCNLELNVAGDRLINISSPIDSMVNQGNLCKRGKFGALKAQNTRRVTVPMIKRGDELIETSWRQALDILSRKFKEIRDRDGGARLAVMASGLLTNEESYLIQKLTRMALETNNIGGLTSSIMEEGFITGFNNRSLTSSFSDIDTSDLIMVLGYDLTQDYPVVASRIRQTVRNGAKLVTISPSITGLDTMAKVDLKINPKTNIAFLRAVLNYILSYDLVDRSFDEADDGFYELEKEMKKYPFNEIAPLFWVKPSRIIEAIHLYIQAKRPVIIINAATFKPEELALIKDLAIITGNAGREGTGIIALRTPGNAQGQIDFGVSADLLPGAQPFNNKEVCQKLETVWQKPLPVKKGLSTEMIIDGVDSGDIQGVLVFGTDTDGKQCADIFKNVSFSVMVSSSIPEKGPYPDIVLPLATFVESEGTFTNAEGRVQYLERAVYPASGKDNWEVISLLAQALDYPMPYNSLPEIVGEISRVVPAYNNQIKKISPPFLNKSKAKNNGRKYNKPRKQNYDTDKPETLKSKSGALS